MWESLLTTSEKALEQSLYAVLFTLSLKGFNYGSEGSP